VRIESSSSSSVVAPSYRPVTFSPRRARFFNVARHWSQQRVTARNDLVQINRFLRTERLVDAHRGWDRCCGASELEIPLSCLAARVPPAASAEVCRENSVRALDYRACSCDHRTKQGPKRRRGKGARHPPHAPARESGLKRQASNKTAPHRVDDLPGPSARPETPDASPCGETVRGSVFGLPETKSFRLTVDPDSQALIDSVQVVVGRFPYAAGSSEFHRIPYKHGDALKNQVGFRRTYPAFQIQALGRSV